VRPQPRGEKRFAELECGATNRWAMPCLSPYHFSSRPRAYHGEIRECLDVGVAEERLETVPLSVLSVVSRARCWTCHPMPNRLERGAKNVSRCIGIERVSIISRVGFANLLTRRRSDHFRYRCHAKISSAFPPHFRIVFRNHLS